MPPDTPGGLGCACEPSLEDVCERYCERARECWADFGEDCEESCLASYDGADTACLEDFDEYLDCMYEMSCSLVAGVCGLFDPSRCFVVYE
jgi:hypothetical protein